MTGEIYGPAISPRIGRNWGSTPRVFPFLYSLWSLKIRANLQESLRIFAHLKVCGKVLRVKKVGEVQYVSTCCRGGNLTPLRLVVAYAAGISAGCYRTSMLT